MSVGRSRSVYAVKSEGVTTRIRAEGNIVCAEIVGFESDGFIGLIDNNAVGGLCAADCEEVGFRDSSRISDRFLVRGESVTSSPACRLVGVAAEVRVGRSGTAYAVKGKGITAGVRAEGNIVCAEIIAFKSDGLIGVVDNNAVGGLRAADCEEVGFRDSRRVSDRFFVVGESITACPA